MSENVFGELVDENIEGMEQWIDGLAVVTDVCSGIGAAVTRKLVKLGINVVGIAENIETLDAIAKELTGERGTFHLRQCNLTNEEEIVDIFAWIEETLGPISVLINNASVLTPTNLTGGSTEAWRKTFDVNVLALCTCTRQAIRSMKAHGVRGHVVHVGSIAGHYEPKEVLPQPVLNVFAASKHAVVAITDILRIELNRIQSKIKISTVSPGLTAMDTFKELSGYIEKEENDVPTLKPDDVANAIIYTLSTPPGVQVQDILIRAVGEVL